MNGTCEFLSSRIIPDPVAARIYRHGGVQRRGLKFRTEANEP